MIVPLLLDIEEVQHLSNRKDNHYGGDKEYN
eukprot:CAMPEP_0170539910 /NCGR_PEP_ID=MMETSP0209-20121228/104297_1 /TAXON_ID=665100 ORGANISM="Litonotus pictus, Strain P1" /NCGR_SAMPLE_ID=MMETSP0209 /ASSEMBLY_ACC=CAM_ASM_000301 /LENGTH=30 /DNA_ID= /DNA_START= /DNA_END= /DNA_ORIENTATION=